MQDGNSHASVKFRVPNEENPDEEESSYLSHASGRMLEPQTYSTDEDSSYSMDRLNSSDFFDAPEAAISVPGPRVKRVSQEKKRGHFKSKSEEKEIKRRLQAARDVKAQHDIKECSTEQEEEEEVALRKKPSRSEAKLRRKSRSMERDDKNSPTTEAVMRLANETSRVQLSTSRPSSQNLCSAITNVSEYVIEKIGNPFHNLMRQRHGSGESIGSRDGDDLNRKMFHKNFVKAMKMGKRAFKEREEKGRTLPEKHSIQRQHSEIVSHGMDKMNHELLFMALQAHRKRMDIEDCITLIYGYRDQVPEKIKQVNLFQYIEESEYVDNNISELLSSSFNMTNCYLDNIEAAIEQVEGILETIDMVQSLFPNTAGLRKEFEVSGSKEYQKRVCALNMWWNSAKALISGITTVGYMAGVEKMPCIQWPFIDPIEGGLNGSVQSSTHIDGSDSVPESPDADSEESPSSTANDSNKRHVTFGISTPLSSSPSNNSGHLFIPPVINTDSSINSKHMFMSTSLTAIDIEASPTSFYRPMVDRLLRKTSLLDMMKSKAPPLVRPLLKAKYAIIKLEMEPVAEGDGVEVRPPELKYCDVLPLSPNHDLITIDDKVQRGESRDSCFSSLHQQFVDMKLPSLIPLYVFLSRSSLDLTHESLRLRLEQHIDSPSLPIIRQVVHECSEAAKVAISVKQSYQYWMCPVTKKANISDEVFERYIERFNCDMREILEVYFGYVEYGMVTLNKETTPHLLKTFLEEEWNFSKEICPFITGGMADAGKRFCGMCSVLLQNIQNELEQELDKSLFDSNPTVYSSEGYSSPTSDPASPEMFGVCEDLCTTADYRQMLMKSCREIKTLFTQMREWASKALGFAKLLRKDLEISAEFKVKVDSDVLMSVLQHTRHVRVITPHTANYMIAVPANIQSDKHSLLALLDVTCGREDIGAEVTPTTREGYLLLINTGEEEIKWKGEVLNVEPKTETTIALSHIGVDGLFLIVTHSSQLNRQRKEFCNLTRDAVELVNEQTTCHQAIAEAWSDLRANAFELASGVQKAIEHVENQLDSTDLQSLDTDSDRKTIKGTYKETLHQCYSFGFEFLQEFNRLNTSCGQAALNKDKILLSFAHQWMMFVLNKCERGKGTRPRWANPGFDFLSMITEPSITKNLDDDEFMNLKSEVEAVVDHIIGESNAGNLSPALRRAQNSSTRRFLSLDNGKVAKRQTSTGSSSSSKKGALSEPSMSLFDRPDGLRPRSESSASSLYSVPSIPESPTYPPEMLPPDRAQAAVNALERNRDETLRDKRVIGRVTDCLQNTNIVRINVRRVNFKWQRGQKIGEGQFGIVYTAVNCDTNCMMAMKELRFKPNDVQTIKVIADELKTFEGINHPNLVKYYGIEVHKEEIFIFMEYCNEGTLEEMSKIGLTESLIRRYTRELVIAVEYLHEHNIIHRDIKGANIFLVANDNLKLGDFGCSAKLKEHTTIPGEMMGFVGTAAFMAPEIFTRKGHGRSADIWSLGCVVIEMVTRKRPWHDMENMHQIMFKVGMGNSPAIPECFHQEGKQFLFSCFQVDPNGRSTASELRGHTFLKV